MISKDKSPTDLTFYITTLKEDQQLLENVFKDNLMKQVALLPTDNS
jgi:hypothetical protein